MGRSYKRDSKGRFAGGGGFTKLNRALAKGGIKTKGYKRAVKHAERMKEQRVRRQLQTLVNMEARDMGMAGGKINHRTNTITYY